MIHALFAKKLNGNLLKKRTTPCEKMTCFKKFKEEFIQACHEIILYYLYAYENYLQVYNHFHEQKCFLLTYDFYNKNMLYKKYKIKLGYRIIWFDGFFKCS